MYIVLLNTIVITEQITTDFAHFLYAEVFLGAEQKTKVSFSICVPLQDLQ